MKIASVKAIRLMSVLILLTTIISAQQVFGDVSVVGDWEGTIGGTSHTHTAQSGPDRALIFIAHGEMDGTMNCAEVYYGGQEMTKVVDRDYRATIDIYAAAFILDEDGIAAATSNTFSITWDTNPAEIKYASAFLENVDQDILTGASATAGGTSSIISTSALATSDGDMVILGASCGNSGSYIMNNGFTEGIDQSAGSSTGATGYKSATGAAETPSVEHSGANRQALIGFVVQGASPDPNIASNPNPGNGADNASLTASLSWDGPTAYTPTSYDVYFGTDSNAHNNPKYTVYTESYDPGGDLEYGTPYYWAVDCNDNGTIHPGFPWSFTTLVPVNIDLNTTQQTIRGFGGMNFPRWIGTLTNAQVDTAFGNGAGQIGMTILRIDIPPDSGYWSGELSAAQRAVNNHGAIVFASPWSPPGWMKRYTDPENPLIGGELDPDFYDDYADHLTDFADYMSSNGVSLYAISLQNEPDVSVGYESCDWTSTQMRNFLKNNASVIPTRVMVAESYHFARSFTDPILNDPCAEAQADVIAGHIYGGGLYDYPLARSKGKEVWMTEHYTDSTHDANDWPNALGVGKEIHDCMSANMHAYIWWYIRRFYGPIGEDGSITKRGYCMSHFAKFVRPGYIRVSATANPTSGVYVTAYKSGDTVVIVAVNQNSSSREVTFSLSGGGVSSYTKYETSSSNSLSNMGSVGRTNTLAGYSISTFVGTTTPGDLNDDGVVDLIDFAILGEGWLDIYDYDTLADLAYNWLYGI